LSVSGRYIPGWFSKARLVWSQQVVGSFRCKHGFDRFKIVGLYGANWQRCFIGSVAKKAKTKGSKSKSRARITSRSSRRRYAPRLNSSVMQNHEVQNTKTRIGRIRII
jgi:hypothetical protein